MNWIQQNWALLLPLVLGACGVWLMMPGARSIRPLGGLACLGSLVLGFQLVAGSRDVSGLMFLLFSTGALVSAVLMITSRNPVYAALWFAVVTLSVCGLFLLQSAPFLAAASIIVYAGAIIVTFLFVIMLAQQAGTSNYDLSSRQPLCASVAAFTLLGLLLITFQSAAAQQITDGARDSNVAAANKALDFKINSATDDIHKSSRPLPNEEIGQLRGLGRALFTDYLFAVEIGGTLLLIASIGAIALAPRRAQGDAMNGSIEPTLLVSAALFALGAIGFLTRRNLISVILSAEMMLHGVALSMVTFGKLHGNNEGQIFTIFILTVAACEAGLALALILSLYHRTKSLDMDLWSALREDDMPSPVGHDSTAGAAQTDTHPANPTLTPAGVSIDPKTPLTPLRSNREETATHV